MIAVGQVLRVAVAHIRQYSNPITVPAGEKVHVGREDEEFPGWKWCTAADGRQGWVPVELLSADSSEAIVLQDYSAVELQVRPGDEVMVEEARHEWLRVRNQRGERGWIPASCTENK